MSTKRSQASRRKFLSTLGQTAAAVGLAAIATPLHAAEDSFNVTDKNYDDPDAWFNKIKGKHRIVFDVTKPFEIYPFAWPRIFLLTNEATGTPQKDSNAVVILRHEGIPYAFNDSVWQKYNFGEVFKVTDPLTKAAAVRNYMWKPKPGDFKVPGIGNVAIGINELQDSGVMFCVCHMAITVYSAALAQGMGKDAKEVREEWMSNLLPGIQVVPSGVWAVGRAQEHGCAYCYV